MNQGSIFVTVLARTRVLSRFANGGGEVFPNSKKCLRMRRYWLGRVAQLVRAPASHAGGHRFESCRAHHSSCFAGSLFRSRVEKKLAHLAWRIAGNGTLARPRECLVHIGGFQYPETSHMLLGLGEWPIGNEHRTIR